MNRKSSNVSISAYQRAAEAGNADAQLALGLLYATGRGVPASYVSAHMWLNLAAMRGSEEARAQRLGLAAEMSPEEVAEAQRLARQWVGTRRH